MKKIFNGDLKTDLTGKLLNYDEKPKIKKYYDVFASKTQAYRLFVGEECYFYANKKERDSDHKNANEFLEKEYKKEKPKKIKIYKTVFQIVILSEEPYGKSPKLDDIMYDTTEGHSLGSSLGKMSETILVGKAAVKAAKSMGSDASFFEADEDGNKEEW
jgi:hypothetical protein